MNACLVDEVATDSAVNDAAEDAGPAEDLVNEGHPTRGM